MSKKLEQVLEYLIAGKQDKAKELLHQVFIEKARKIHEDIMSHDDMDEDRAIGGDDEDDWTRDIMGKHDRHLSNLSDEIDAEETMAEDEDTEIEDDDTVDMHDDDEVETDDDEDEVDLDDDDEVDDDEEIDSEDEVDDEVDTEHSGMEGVEDSIGDLEDALAELKAEFERLESGEDVDDEVSDEDTVKSDEEESDEESDEDMDESWLEEDWDDLAEAIELEKVKVPASGEVGSGKFSSDVGEKAKSPTATSQTQRMGAKPVTVDSKKHNGFNRESAPTSKELGITNRRKTADTGMSKVSKEGNASAALNKTVSEFGIDKNSMSPLSKSPRK